jgi:hypothetical protein
VTVYTFWGNTNEHTDGTSVMVLQSGEVPIGHSGDFDIHEYQYLVNKHILLSGNVPWNRTDFPWQQESLNFIFTRGALSGGGDTGGGGVPTIFTPTYTDSFDRADSVVLGSNWLNSSDGGLHIASNIVQGDASALRGDAYVNAAFGNNQYSQIAITATPLALDDWIAPAVRIKNNGQTLYAALYWNDRVAGRFDATIYKRVNGTYTPISSSYPFQGALPAGTILTLSVQGNNLLLYQDGNLIISTNDTSIASGGFPGIVSSGASATANNWGGDSIGVGATTGVPSNTTAPVISGVAQQSNSLTCSTGAWANNPLVYEYQWQSDALGPFSNIPGATSNTHICSASDAGNNLRCVVMAYNALGSGVAANSASVGPIVGSPASYSDNFDRANGALGANWAASTAASDHALQIATNQVKGSAVGGVTPETAAGWSADYRVSEVYVSNHFSQVSIGTSPGSHDWIGPSIRVQNNGGTCYFVKYLNNAGTYVYQLFKRINGVSTQIGSTSTLAGAAASGTVINLHANGTTITLTQNGSTMISVSDSSITSGGAPGIAAYGNTATVDNWSGGYGTSGTTPPPGPISPPVIAGAPPGAVSPPIISTAPPGPLTPPVITDPPPGVVAPPVIT